MKNEERNLDQNQVSPFDGSNLLAQLRSKALLMVSARRRNGLIIYKSFHAEFAGPGAAIGSYFDVDCINIIPIGDLSLVELDSQEERQKAYLIRRQWIRLAQQLTDNPYPLQRAQMILNQFENYFGAGVVAQVPDEALALLVGVLPQTMRMARSNFGNLHGKAKT